MGVWGWVLLGLVWVLFFLLRVLPFLVLLLSPPWLLLLLLFCLLCLRCQLLLASLPLLLPLLFFNSLLWLLPFPLLPLLSPQLHLCFLCLLLLVFLWLLRFVHCPLLGSFGCSLLIPCVFSYAVWPCCFVSFSPFLCPYPCRVFSSRSCRIFFFLSFCLSFFGRYRHLLVLADYCLLLGSFSLFLFWFLPLLWFCPWFHWVLLLPLLLLFLLFLPRLLATLRLHLLLFPLLSPLGVLVFLLLLPGSWRVLALPPPSCGSILDFAGASGASNSPKDAFLQVGFDDSSVKGKKEGSTLGKAYLSKAFHDVALLMMSFFPHAKPASSSSSLE